MEEIKHRWQLIIGFAAVIISLSAFKEDLSAIVIDFKFISFSAFRYLFYVTIGFVFIIHLYVVPYVFSTSSYRIFSYMEKLSYILFLGLIASPYILIVGYFFEFLFLKVTPFAKYESLTQVAILVLQILIAFKFFRDAVDKHILLRRSKEDSEIIEKEVLSADLANRMSQDGLYNQSVFELFKVLETGIYRILKAKNLIYRPAPLQQMIAIINKYNVFSAKQMETLNKLKIQRDMLSHDAMLITSKDEVDTIKDLIREVLLMVPVDADKVPTDRVDKVDTVQTDRLNIARYFLGNVYEDLTNAKLEAIKSNKPLFIIIYDNSHPTLSRMSHGLGYFMEYISTKELVRDNFIQVLVSSDKPGVNDLVPPEVPLEKCYLVILAPDGRILRQETVSANQDVGLNTIKLVIQNWSMERNQS